MNDIIDDELTEGKLLDLSTVLKWMLVAILGCIVFQSLEVFFQRLLILFIESQGIFSGNTSFLLSEIITAIFLLIIFYNIIQGFKSRYYKNNVNIRKTLIRLVILYVVINLVHTIIPKLLFAYPRSDGPDPLAYYNVFTQVFFLLETFLKYGLAAWILLRKN